MKSCLKQTTDSPGSKARGKHFFQPLPHPTINHWTTTHHTHKEGMKLKTLLTALLLGTLMFSASGLLSN